MYAQLCKRLDEEAPNFEPPDQLSTFRQLLLKKCKKEFENRSAILEQYGSNSDEDAEKRHVTKSKMLGNIKFMGELGKLGILNENILHRCIHELLVHRRNDDPDEDLECLCQIMKTCGRVLDSVKGRYLMNQYFGRMQLLVDKADLQPRIKFMLKDIIDLRQDKWIPRKATVVEGPMPIHQIRPAEDDRMSFRRQERNNERGDPDRGSAELFRHPLKTRGGFDDMLRGLTLSPAPTTNLVPAGPYGPNGFGQKHNNGGGGNQRGGGGQFVYGGNGNQRGQYKHNQNNNRDNSKDASAPTRVKKGLIVSHENIGDVELRPNSNLFNKALVKTNNLVNNSKSSVGSDYNSPMPIKVSTPLLKEPLPIKQASQERPKQSKKDKGPSKEEVVQKFGSILDDFWKGDLDLKQTVNAYKEQKVPDKFSKDVVLTGFIQALDKTDVEQEKVIKLIGAIKEAGNLNSSVNSEVLKSFCHTLEEAENENSSGPSVLLGTAVIEELASLAEIASLTEGGNLYPLFLLTLQHIHRRRGRTELTDLFGRSKVNLLSQLPENDRSKEKLSEVLEERDLAFLYPLLRIQAELSRQLQAESNPQAFYKWIRDHLDPASLSEPGFVSALITALLKYISEEGASNSDGDEKVIGEKEKAMLSKYRPVLQAFLREKHTLQLSALYSLQTYFHSMGFPRGQLLRWFMAMYDLEIIDEDAYFNWKEDITDAYPGKGQALFQVNQWLTWLQEAESEEEEGDD